MVTDFKLVVSLYFIFQRFQQIHNHFDDFPATGANQVMVLMVLFMKIQFIANTTVVQAQFGEDAHFTEQKESTVNCCQTDFRTSFFDDVIDFFSRQVFSYVLHHGIQNSPALGSQFVAFLFQALSELICNNNDTSFSCIINCK